MIALLYVRAIYKHILSLLRLPISTFPSNTNKNLHKALFGVNSALKFNKSIRRTSDNKEGLARERTQCVLLVGRFDFASNDPSELCFVLTTQKGLCATIASVKRVESENANLAAQDFPSLVACLVLSPHYEADDIHVSSWSHLNTSLISST